MSIYVVGDIHAEFSYLNRFIEGKAPDILLCCGDFGYWENHRNGWYHDKLKNPKTKVYFCDGNHECHPALVELVDEYGWKNPIEIQKDLFYCPRGSSIVLPTGESVLFFGGADSIDKDWRTPGRDWFPEENISQREIDRLDGKYYDIVVSHTCPSPLVKPMLNCLGLDSSYPKYSDPNSKALDVVYESAKPSKWYFGHWHVPYDTVIDNCEFRCLNMVPRSGYWFEHVTN